MIVATAGHIDHGKTALVKALTGVDADRLPEEKARGISIDIGFAYWTTPGGATVGFVDVPGHEKFVRNMLAGVCGIDLAMLVVAADDGVMPQTREHLHILDLLGVNEGIAVITKADRADPRRLDQVTAEVKALLAPTALAAADVIPVSAVTGAGIERLRAALGSIAASWARQFHAGRRFRYAVDRAFVVAGSGTVVTGTVFDGTVAVGDKFLLSPSGLQARVRGIQKDGKAAPGATAGERCALNLAGVELSGVRRGDWLLHPALHAPTMRIDVRVKVLEGEPHPLRHWTPVHLHLGTRDVPARVAMRRGGALAPGETGIAQLVLDQSAAALHGDRFILRDQSATRTLGGGVVLDPWPPRQRRNPAQRLLQLAALEPVDPEQALRALQVCSPAGIDLAQFGRSFNLDDRALSALAGKCGLETVGKSSPTALPRTTVAEVCASVERCLDGFHKASPQAPGMDIRTLRGECAPALAAPLFQDLLQAMAAQQRIELTGSIARRPRHVASDNPADRQMWDRVRPLLQQAAHAGLLLTELASAAGAKEAILADFLHRMAKTGELVRVGTSRFYLRATMASFAAVAQCVAELSPGGRFTVAQFRDRAGVGRMLSVDILESLDRLGVTQRVGDARVLRRDFTGILGPAEVPPLPAARSAAPPQPARGRNPNPRTFRR